MTLFTRRGMPTLSLQGRVCLPLFLFIFALSQLAAANPLNAQDLKNRTEEMYRLGRIIIASESLPDQVYNAQKYKVIVSVVFFEKGTDKIITSGLGTGFTSDRPGIILTARHVLSESILEANRIKIRMIKTNPRFDYTYVFMGTIITSDQWLNFPLSLAAMGENGTFKDIMALKVDVQTMEWAQIQGDVINPNPLNALTHVFEFADANLGENVFITGFAPVVTEGEDKNKNPTSTYIDMINFTFLAEVTAKIENMPVNKVGVKLMYRLRDGAEPGFSGGLVLNARGQVVGMTIAVTISNHFVYVISSKDLKDFLKDNKLK